MKKKKLWIVLILVVLVGASVAFYVSKNRQKVIEVQVDKVKRQQLIARVTASGKIQPKKKVDISASIPGKIVRLAVEEGAQVKAGDFLLQIDPAPYEAAVANAKAALNGARSELESARASLKQADQTYKRKAKMWEDNSGLISQDEYERSKTDFDVLQARVRSAEHAIEQSAANLARSEDDLSKTQVTSPMTGIVVRRAVEEGEVAVTGTMNNAGTVLLTVADLSVMQAELEVDESDIGAIQLGQTGTVTVDAFPGKKFQGEVTEIGNSPIVKSTAATNQESTDFKVTITLRAPEVTLRPGLTADGEIVTATRSSCLTVPIQALVIRDISNGKSGLTKDQREKEGVFLMANGKAIFKQVKTGIMGEMDIEVKDGLEGNEQIVTGTYQTLRDLKDGDAIKIKKEDKKEMMKKA
jgi:HlyD family secretion protein